MSDNEYYSDEIDIESNNASPANAGLDDFKKHARAQHNALERRRRDNIKDMYTSLKDEISNFSNSERASRAHILKKTIEQIEGQKAEVQDLDEEVNQLRKQNAKLLAEIQERETAFQVADNSLPAANSSAPNS